MSHTDFEAPFWKRADESPLLRGLSHPCTFNIALEDKRSMWINKISNEVTYTTNEIAILSGDVYHGGLSQIFNPADPVPKYSPALHIVLGSWRFPRIPNEVRLGVTFDTYCADEHVSYLDEDDAITQLLKIHKQMQILLKRFKDCPDMIPEVKEVLAIYDHNKTGEQVEGGAEEAEDDKEDEEVAGEQVEGGAEEAEDAKEDEEVAGEQVEDSDDDSDDDDEPVSVMKKRKAKRKALFSKRSKARNSKAKKSKRGL
jgi:hypothetical protein